MDALPQIDAIASNAEGPLPWNRKCLGRTHKVAR